MNAPLLPYCRIAPPQFIDHPCSCFTPFIDLSDIYMVKYNVFTWSSSYVTIFILCDTIMHVILIMVFIMNVTIFMIGHVLVLAAR